MLNNVIEIQIAGMSDKIDKTLAKLDQEIKNGLEAKIERLNSILDSADKRNTEYFKRRYWIDKCVGYFMLAIPLYVIYLILKLFFIK